MSPISHFVGSWLIAAVTTDNLRDRKLVTLAGVIPDVDGMGILIDWGKALLTGEPATYNYYHHYHHILLHGWPGALAVAIALTFFAQKRWRVFLLCLVIFHVHLLCDLVGSRGPSPSDLWPISYGEPLWRQPIWIWRSQWRLDGWQNKVVFVGLFGSALWLASTRGYSFLELFSRKLDTTVVGVLQQWRTRALARWRNRE